MSGVKSVTKKKNYVRKSKEELDKEIKDLTSSTLEKIQSYTTSEKDILEYMDFMSRFHNYSPKNMSLIQTQFPGALGVGSFKKFKDAGFSVNRGEKGIKIFVPTPVELFQAEDGTTKYLTQATTEEKEKIKTNQLKVNKVQRYKLGTVFDISQTNANPEDLPKIFPNKHFNHDMKDPTLLKGMEAGLMNIGQELGVPIRNMDQAGRELGNIKGVYVQQKTKDGTPVKSEIIMNTRNTETESIGTLIHELAHAKAHSSTKISTAEQEFQAEMISHVVSKHFGMDTTEEAVPYIADWSKNGQLVEDKVKSLEEVHSISRGFIETIESSIAEERIIAIERLEKEIEEKLERLNKNENIDIDSREFEMQQLKENQNFSLSEKNQDLFLKEDSSVMVHSISKDSVMGKGIAKTFDQKYPNMKPFLQSQELEIGKAYRYVEGNQVIYNLVTKEHYYDKPTRENFEKAIDHLKEEMTKHEETKLSMPRIGSGLDKLDWDKNVQYIENVFKETNTEIVIYSPNQKIIERESSELNNERGEKTYNKPIDEVFKKLEEAYPKVVQYSKEEDTAYPGSGLQRDTLTMDDRRFVRIPTEPQYPYDEIKEHYLKEGEWLNSISNNFNGTPEEIETRIERAIKTEMIDRKAVLFNDSAKEAKEIERMKEQSTKSESEVMEYPESTYKKEVKEIFETTAKEHPEFAVYSKDSNIHQLTIGDKRFSTSPFDQPTKSDLVFTEDLENEEWKLNLFVDTDHSIPEVVQLVKKEIDQATNNRKEPGEIQKQKEMDNNTNLESEDFTENLNKAIKQRNYVSQEEVQLAKSVDILDFALSNGVSLEQDGNNYYRLTEHDSCVIDRRNNSFHWNGANVHGDSILFAQKIVGIKGFQDSVRALNGGNYEKIQDVEFKSEPYQYKTKEVPFNEAKRYLINERKIDTGIVTSLNNKGIMVQDERNNVVFKWCKDGEIIGASEQGIVKSDRYKRGSWKHVQESSENGQGFNFTIGKPENLKIFESSIDLLSYASIHKADLHDTRLVAMEGLKTSTVVTSINDSMEKLGDAPKSISLCVDNDKAGHEFMKQFSSMQFKNNDGEIIPVTSEFPEIPEEKQVEGIDKWDWGNERVYQIEKKQDRFKGISKQTSGYELEI